jgi:V8-like Glu-specific endopeptidase
MTFTQHLPSSRIEEIAKAAQELGLLGTSTREILWEDINPAFRYAIPDRGTPGGQLLTDLSRLNQTERLLDGTVPLEQWLRQAFRLSGLDERAVIFQRALDELAVRTSGQPQWIAPDDLPEYQEAIIHQDDKIPFGFLEQGFRVGASVAKVQVPRYEGGRKAMLGAKPVIYNGTCWLIGPRQLITNLHVVNARDAHEPPATVDDLRLQAQNASVLFGFDADGRSGASFDGTTLTASDQQLDFAILELAPDPGFPPLPLADASLAMEEGKYPPLNIIQHPMGGPKMIAIRNNLATRSTDTDLRYFTDTDYGSSGSPVLNDNWAVVALHRAASAARQPVKFQGRSTAVVNVGTRISKVREHLQAHHPDLWQRITG